MFDVSKALIVKSDQASKRMEVSYQEFETDIQKTQDKGEVYDYILDETKHYQTILGFGGAFTDSAGININMMNDSEITMKIISAYYGPNGLDYSLGRVNMGGCDFSIRPYTYADTEGDVNLDTFALQDEDVIHKVCKTLYTANVLIVDTLMDFEIHPFAIL